MAKILENTLSCEKIDRVIVIDNSCDDSLQGISSISNEKVEYCKMNYNSGAGYRFERAAREKCNLVLCVDDDIFLTPLQMNRLLKASINNAHRLNGVWGQQVTRAEGKTWLKGGIYGIDGELDILNRVYCFAPAYADLAIELANSIGFQNWASIGPVDDVLLSYAGKQRPFCHNIGPIEDCPSSNDPEIAVWKTPGFHKIRAQLIDRIIAKRGC